MALSIKHLEVEFGIGDKVKVFQRIKEGDKTRLAFFEGVVIAIKNALNTKSFTVRRIGEAGIGIEKIFPLGLPTLEKIEVIKKGLRGTRRAKLYYIREKSPKEIDKIYWRNNAREKAKQESRSTKSHISSKLENNTKETIKVKKPVKKASKTN